tara:strand:+ start:606 stop:950 length:345 start_codon:yes stop_codon:yes gene_type:complete
MIVKPQLSVINNNIDMVSTIVGNETYFISVEKEKELIEKAYEYKKSLSRKNPIPRNYLYGLWVNIYQDSGYDFYLEPIQMKLFESKWKRAISNFFRKTPNKRGGKNGYDKIKNV